MGFNDHIDWDLVASLQDLVEEGELEEGTPAYGIVQQVIHQGYDSLSSKQLAVYDNIVVPALKRRGEEISIIQTLNSNPD
jgi:hypothetical protein